MWHAHYDSLRSQQHQIALRHLLQLFQSPNVYHEALWQTSSFQKRLYLSSHGARELPQGHFPSEAVKACLSQFTYATLCRIKSFFTQATAFVSNISHDDSSSTSAEGTLFESLLTQKSQARVRQAAKEPLRTSIFWLSGNERTSDTALS